MIDVAGRATWAHSHRLLLGVDPHALHRRQVDDQAVVDAAETRTIVAAAANGDRELVVAAEIDGRNDIADICASSDDERAFVDHAVVELAGFFVFCMTASDHRPTQTRSELSNSFLFHRETSLLCFCPTAEPADGSTATCENLDLPAPFEAQWRIVHLDILHGY